MDSPLIEKFLYQKEKDMCRPLAVRAEAALSGLGNLRLRRAALRNPSSARGVTEAAPPDGASAVGEGSRGRPGRQEIITARWGCPAREGGAVHEGGKRHLLG